MTFKIRREQERQEREQIPSVPHGDWAEQTLHGLLYAAYREQRSTRFWRNVWRGVGVLLFVMTLATVHSCSTQLSQSGKSSGRPVMSGSSPHTAVISLSGTIGGGYQDQVEMLREGLEAAYDNKQVKGIIIRANSPGGSPVIANTAFNEIRRLKEQHSKIPLYVVAEDMCASGCYYIAAAADKIYADPSSLVGSIGVIGSGFDFTGLMDKLGVKRRQRIAGGNKGMGDPFIAETPEQQAIWQQMLNDIHGEFIRAVKSGRGERLLDQQYPDVYSGRIYSGLEAEKVGLIDGFGSVYSIARDEIQAPELVDYTPQDDDLARAISRRLNSEVQGAVRQWQEQGW